MSSDQGREGRGAASARASKKKCMPDTLAQLLLDGASSVSGEVGHFRRQLAQCDVEQDARGLDRRALEGGVQLVAQERKCLLEPAHRIERVEHLSALRGKSQRDELREVNGGDLQRLAAAEKLAPHGALRGYQQRGEKFAREVASVARSTRLKCSLASQVLHSLVHAVSVEQRAAAVDLRVAHHLVEIEHGKLEQVSRSVEDLHAMRRVPVREHDL